MRLADTGHKAEYTGALKRQLPLLVQPCHIPLRVTWLPNSCPIRGGCRARQSCPHGLAPSVLPNSSTDFRPWSIFQAPRMLPSSSPPNLSHASKLAVTLRHSTARDLGGIRVKGLCSPFSPPACRHTWPALHSELPELPVLCPASLGALLVGGPLRQSPGIHLSKHFPTSCPLGWLLDLNSQVLSSFHKI